MATLDTLIAETRNNWRTLLAWGLVFALLWQFVMLLALIVRFGALPNYYIGYNWPANVWHIIQSTPSWSDMLPIIREEWMLEAGRMNYDYGTGISEWSLNVVPSRMLVLFCLGALCGLFAQLSMKLQCPALTRSSTMAATGTGALLVTMTSATMSWVVCCATPSWVVGLAMLGLGVSTSLALESMGPTLMGSGFAILLSSVCFLAWQQSRSGHSLDGAGLNTHA